MELAASVPKTTPFCGDESTKEFAGTEEVVKRELAHCAGKALLLSDGALALSAFPSPRAIGAVFEGDALPLFSMPDGISRVMAAGDRETLFAARYFAEVRNIPCILFPSDAALDGVFEKRGEILLGGERVAAPLKEGYLVCDPERMRPSCANAYARILLGRIAKIETEALNEIRAARLVCVPATELPASFEELVEANAALRRAEAEGAYAGEGIVLAELLGGEPVPCWNAYLLLSALYAAFFGKGKPRRYFTPDYRARAERAGTEYAPRFIPTAEEYVSRAMELERVRARFAAETLALLDGREACFRAVSSRTERRIPSRGGRTDVLSLLPEHAPTGLSAVIRDFGLMEWDYDKGRTFARN